MPSRLLFGSLLAGTIALLAWRVRALSGGGALAAIVVGVATAAAGWDWATMLVVFFVTSIALSRLGAERKALRTADIIAKGGARDALQVFANGGAFAAAATLAIVAPHPEWTTLGGGALATAAADTWATEVGMLSRRTPRSIISGRRIPPGSSGGITLVGMVASLGGAAAIAGAALLLGWTRADAIAAFGGGVIGSVVDSLLGATVQQRRRCVDCGGVTEREVHTCGGTTQHLSGARWLDNDAVNVLSGVAGALTALLVRAVLDHTRLGQAIT